MKIVSFGDVHMATSNLSCLREEMMEADLVILSGDLTNFGGARDASRVIADVRAYCTSILALPGNLDQPEVADFLEAEGIALHGRGLVLHDVAIFGCGGSNITPFKTPMELNETQIYNTLARGYDRVAGTRPLLMVCHAPPIATKCDRLIGGQAVGSSAARRFIEEVKPDVCISGHIHESAGVDKIGTTTIVNAGPFKSGGYVVVTSHGRSLETRLEFV